MATITSASVIDDIVIGADIDADGATVPNRGGVHVEPVSLVIKARYAFEDVFQVVEVAVYGDEDRYLRSYKVTTKGLLDLLSFEPIPAWLEAIVNEILARTVTVNRI